MTETATLTWFSGNYGSTMQAFALQKTVMELGYGNHIINYVPNKWEKLTYDSNSEIDYRYLACIFLSYCENIINIRRENRFSCAQKQEEII